MCEPLHIRACLQTPVISDGYLPLDGLLYYHIMRERHGEQIVTIPGQSYGGPVDHDLPLKKINSHTRQWFYACSFAVWPEHTREGMDYWNKKLDLSLVHLVEEKGRRVDIAAGRYKSYHMPVFYRTALYVDWYAVGDKREIERLLRFCLWLGKKTSQGWGAVKEWAVEPWPQDWSVYSSTGRLMRAIPSSDLKAPCYGLRPSYWSPKHQFPCQLPPLSRQQ